GVSGGVGVSVGVWVGEMLEVVVTMTVGVLIWLLAVTVARVVMIVGKLLISATMIAEDAEIIATMIIGSILRRLSGMIEHFTHNTYNATQFAADYGNDFFRTQYGHNGWTCPAFLQLERYVINQYVVRHDRFF